MDHTLESVTHTLTVDWVQRRRISFETSYYRQGAAGISYSTTRKHARHFALWSPARALGKDRHGLIEPYT